MRPLPVEVVRTTDRVPVEVFGLGTVEARILSRVGFEVGAALVELTADHGDRVKQGEVLARLHSGEQEARVAKAKAGLVNRSEEHTSELQSLMRISYAVFCLTKKN